MTTSYTPAQPGSWLLLATAETVLFVEPGAAGAAGDLWTAVTAPAPVQSVLDVLTRGGLSSTPSFALAHVDGDSVHTLVRGEVVLGVSAGDGTQSVEGAGVSTWRETSFTGVTAVTAGTGAGELPLVAGVVWSTGFLFAPGAVATPTAAPAAAPVAAAPVAAQPVAVAPVAPEPVVAAPIVEAPVFAEPPVAVTVPEPVAEPDALSEHTIVEREDEPLLAPPPPAAEPLPVDSTYSHLFEETVHRSIAEAAVREEEPVDEPAPAAPAAPAQQLGDHDGETVMSADIAALRGRKRPTSTAAAPAAARAVYLELPNSQRELLSQPVIIGRSPSVSQVSGAELPRLVTIPGIQDISRSHARFAIEGDSVVVTDLHSRNGTSIALPGKPPQLLRKGEPTVVLPGTVVDLGGAVSLTVREG